MKMQGCELDHWSSLAQRCMPRPSEGLVALYHRTVPHAGVKKLEPGHLYFSCSCRRLLYFESVPVSAGALQSWRTQPSRSSKRLRYHHEVAAAANIPLRC